MQAAEARAEPALQDSFGRRFRYLRVSVIDACNFRCVYCLPQGYCKDPQAAAPLNPLEFRHLIAGFASLGVVKVRITGGEPTLRRDIVELVSIAKQTPGIQEVALSTNGYRLTQLLPRLVDAGLDAVNVSMDSLNEGAFQKVTGSDRLASVREGAEAARRAGLKVKINAVLLRGINDHELPQFMDFVREQDISVRYIELMRTGDNQDLFRDHHLAASSIEATLADEGWALRLRGATDGPAREYEHPAYRGRIGVIAPYSRDFCSGCNRLRISCRGELKLCLFGDTQHSLRAFLQSPDQAPLLHDAVYRLLGLKKNSHDLHEGLYGNTQHFASIGG